MIFLHLSFYNTLTRSKQVFKPIKQGEVSFYSCGPTVYNYAHLGNFRSYCFADLLKRFLEYEGFSVLHVMNLTDVDDKTIKGAREEGAELTDFTAKYEKFFFEDAEMLGIKKPSFCPRATEHVPEMIVLIQKLLSKQKAYQTSDGSVYYAVSSFEDYGELSHSRFDSLKTGASGRISDDDYEKKKSAEDFALWKAWRKEDGGVFWETPFGKGRPGWHIECSTMSMQYLGETFDLHSGGVDLIFPHHENEIAQSEGATGKKFVNYWLHCEHLIVDGKKMAKRFHNFYTLRDVVAKGFSAKAIRFLLLSTHYRSQLNFTFQALEHAQKTLDKLNDLVARLNEFTPVKKADGGLQKFLKKTRADFINALEYDLNVSTALSAVHALAGEANKALEENALDEKTGKELRDFFLKDFNSVFNVLETGKTEVPEEIIALVEARERTRRNKDFKKADELRELIKKKGFVVEDAGRGARVKRM